MKKRVLGWVVNIILIWLIVIVVAFFLLPRFGGWRFDAVLSSSMEPALPLGGVVFIKPVETDEITTGDIIAYRSGELLITHRVVDVIDQADEPSFVTKGDASEDPGITPVSASAVVGSTRIITSRMVFRDGRSVSATRSAILWTSLMWAATRCSIPVGATWRTTSLRCTRVSAMRGSTP